MRKAVLSLVFATALAGAAGSASADVTRSTEVQDRASRGRMTGCEVSFIVERAAEGGSPLAIFGGSLLSFTNQAGQPGMGINLVLLQDEVRTMPSAAWLQSSAGNREEHYRTTPTERASLSVLEVGSAGKAELAILERTGAARVAYELADGAHGAFDLVLSPEAHRAWKDCLTRLPRPTA